MAKDNRTESAGRDLKDVVSVLGPGMQVIGDVKSDGTVRVEGRVEGAVKAAKSVVVGEDGIVEGDIETQDVVVAGRVVGTIVAESRVELQETCRVEGDIRSRRIKLDEGGRVEGRLQMGSEAVRSARSLEGRREGAAAASRPGKPSPASSGEEGSSKPFSASGQKPA